MCRTVTQVSFTDNQPHFEHHYRPGKDMLSRRCRLLPRGLMVFSSLSLSLAVLLEMRAAMEKALALEESCGFGHGLNSIIVPRNNTSLQNYTQPNKPAKMTGNRLKSPEPNLREITGPCAKNRTGSSFFPMSNSTKPTASA